MIRQGVFTIIGCALLVSQARAADQMADMNDDQIFTHVMADQLEEQLGDGGTDLHYEAAGWTGTDENKLWVKSEGTLDANGQFSDGQHEFLYDRAISPFFDLQTGLMANWDQGVAREWAAIGVQGTAPYFIQTEATAYIGEQGRTAFRGRVSTDWLITNRLILTPEIEANFAGKADPTRQARAGLTDFDAGLRLRYELVREFAPYVGVTYHLGRNLMVIDDPNDDPGNGVRFTIGIRSWY